MGKTKPDKKQDQFPDQWKTHDTPERQERERQLIQVYCEKTEATGYWQGGIGSRYDAQIFGNAGTLRELIEVKERKLVRTQIEYLNIDMKKIDWLRDAVKIRRVPVYLVVSWQDGEMTRLDLAKAQPADWSVHEHNSKTRKEFADLQYLIPVQEFERI
jgi:hypothetical protein